MYIHINNINAYIIQKYYVYNQQSYEPIETNDF